VNDLVQRLLAWARNHIEVGAIASILTTVAAYVGQRFYTSYFEFFLLDGIDIPVPMADSGRVFAFILLFSLAMVLLALHQRDSARRLSFLSALADNVPLLVVMAFAGVLSANFYLDNVEALSSWLTDAVPRQDLRKTSATQTPVVVAFLHRWMIFGPPLLAAVIVLVASARRWSFAVHLQRQSRERRYGYLAIYIVLLLNIASSAGHARAFLERAGFLSRPEVRVTLNDGKAVGNAVPTFLITKVDSTYFIASIGDRTTSVETWAIPQGSVKVIEFVPRQSELKGLLKEFL
jgi:hypothetical protein